MHKTDGICKLCNTLERNRTHIFMNCEIINQVYLHFLPLIRRFDNRALSEKEKAFGITENNPKILLRNYMTYTIRHIVYRNRNIKLNNNANINSIIINKVEKHIKVDLMERYNLFKLKGELQTFKNIYLIDNILGELENNNLTLGI